ncbi:hypothetical protein SDC9_207609 [bioreactor metagenome]|uniref:Uncharacterized protein n=1 Tax=bioreactor metagenome TaxID=1076179 RepID=A0A645J920_9ZZZZ
MELFEARQNFPAKEEYKKLYNFIAQLDQESRNKLTAFMYYGRDGGEWKDCLTHAEKCLNWNSQAAASMIADKVHLLRYFENARKLLIKENIDINSL